MLPYRRQGRPAGRPPSSGRTKTGKARLGGCAAPLRGAALPPHLSIQSSFKKFLRRIATIQRRNYFYSVTELPLRAISRFIVGYSTTLCHLYGVLHRKRLSLRPVLLNE